MVRTKAVQEGGIPKQQYRGALLDSRALGKGSQQAEQLKGGDLWHDNTAIFLGKRRKLGSNGQNVMEIMMKSSLRNQLVLTSVSRVVRDNLVRHEVNVLGAV